MTDLDGSVRVEPVEGSVGPVEPVAGSVGPVRSLQELVDAEPRGFLPVRLSFPPVDGMVLRHEGRFADVAVETGEVRSVYIGDTVRLITDPARAVELMRHAAAQLSQQVTQVRQEQQEESQRHSEVLNDIRMYAIKKCREEAICQDGLNAFLRTFDMAPDHTVVRFTITGTYTVAHGNDEAAESDGGRFLDVDLSNIDNVVDDSLSFTVNIDSVQPVDAAKPVDTDD